MVTCSASSNSSSTVMAPVLYSSKSPVKFLNTFWYASPTVKDLDLDGSTPEL